MAIVKVSNIDLHTTKTSLVLVFYCQKPSEFPIQREQILDGLSYFIAFEFT